MLKNILNANGVKELDNKAQKSITGGCPIGGANMEDNCELVCMGQWHQTPFGGLCEIPDYSPC
jgi:hypothetical protein